MQYGMLIDTKRCVACNTCVVACKIENNLPEGVRWNNVVNVGGDNPDSPTGEYPNLTPMWTYTISCQHCTEPACVAVCPAEATWKDSETGIVTSDPEKCIGCGLCIEACPYDVRVMIEDEPKYYLDFATGGQGILPHIKGTVGKCTFCQHRVVDGDVPFCVEVCPARARIFGDLDDPESEVSKKLAERESEQLHTEAGTGPNVYLLR